MNIHYDFAANIPESAQPAIKELVSKQIAAMKIGDTACGMRVSVACLFGEWMCHMTWHDWAAPVTEAHRWLICNLKPEGVK